jgi:hypothetical protein
MRLVPQFSAVAIGKKAIIADLHLGLIRLHDPVLIERAVKLAEKFSTIIIAGDLKHLGKRGMVKEFFECLSISELLIVKGNHDVGLDVRMESSRGIRVGSYGIFHGHAIPSEEVMEAKNLIFAHAHPSVFIPDSVGGYKERVYLRGEVEVNSENKTVLVLPAFNDLCASTAVNLERPAGFAFRKWDYRNWDAILLDGTVLRIGSL